jgi:hypothetical protein
MNEARAMEQKFPVPCISYNKLKSIEPSVIKAGGFYFTTSLG